jgi:predicted MFS family arabinose efflux permease
VGVGVAASGTLVPLLLAKGLHETWMGLGVLSLVLTAVAWTGWPHDTSALPAATSHKPHSQKAPSLWALYAEYALNAAGWVPHMIFFVDFVARGLGLGLQAGAEFWVLFGIGASIGPILSGFLADRIGFGRALRLALILEAVAVVIPAFATSLTWLIASSMVVGAFVTGTVPLVLGRVHELLVHHPAQHNPAWRTATVFFALFQAVAAYALSFVFSINGGNYRSLFVIGTFAIVLALVIDLVDAGRRRRTSSSGAS